MSFVLYHNISLGYAVLNKPSGIDTYGFVTDSSKTILNLFRCVDPTGQRIVKIDNAYPVHRLDKPTSGCLVVGVNRSARRRLAGSLLKHKITKKYLAVLWGMPAQRQGIIDAPLSEERVATNNNGYSFIRVNSECGKPSRTAFKVLSYDGCYCFVELSPLTGRTHQLRVHCAHIGCPIVGDPWYPTPQNQGRALHLHAHKIAMPQEIFGGVEISAALPSHMLGTLKNIPLGHVTFK